MLTPKELSDFKTVENIDRAIHRRLQAAEACVGWLYPAVLQNEIYQLQDRKKELLSVEVKV